MKCAVFCLVFLCAGFAAIGQKVLVKIENIDDEVLFLSLGPDQTIHAATSNNYYRYDPVNTTSTSVPFTKEIDSLLVDKDGNAHIVVSYASDQYYMVVNSRMEVEQWFSGSNYRTDILNYMDSQGFIYYADSLGVYLVRANGTKDKIKGVDRSVYFFIEDNEGNVYINSDDDGFDRNTAVLYPTDKVRPNPTARVANGISDSGEEPLGDVVVDSNNNIFFGILGSNPGLKKLSSDGSITKLLNNAINVVGVDSKNLVYAASWGYQKPRDLYAVPSGSGFPVIIFGLMDMPADFAKIVTNSNNDAYIATLETSIYVIPDGAYGNVTKVEGIPNIQLFRAMTLDLDENVIVLLEDVFYIPKGTTKATKVLGLPPGDKVMVVGKDNVVYIGAEDGLYALLP